MSFDAHHRSYLKTMSRYLFYAEKSNAQISQLLHNTFEIDI